MDEAVGPALGLGTRPIGGEYHSLRAVPRAAAVEHPGLPQHPRQYTDAGKIRREVE